MAAALAWAAADPRSYARWREVVASGLRIFTLANPACIFTRLAALGGGGTGGGAGLLAQAGFLARFVVAVKLPSLLQWSLLARLRLPMHALVQAIAVYLTLRGVPALCASPALQRPAAAAAIRKLAALFNILSFPWSGGSGGGGGGGAALHEGEAPSLEGECWAVTALMQIALGYVLPLVLLAVWEASDFERFREATRGRYSSSVGTLLYEYSSPRPPSEADWERRAKLAIVSWSLFLVLWDVLKLLSASAA